MQNHIQGKIAFTAIAILINLAMMMALGFLTIDSEANFNSRIGAILISFFVPMALVWCTPYMTGTKRTLVYGSGLVLYTILCFIFLEFLDAITSWAVPCFIVALSTLCFGDRLIVAARVSNVS